MWTKTLVGLVGGLAVAVSLMMNLHFLLPIALDGRLLTGLLAGFVLWGGTMTWCYACENARRAGVGCVKVLSVSVLLNVILML